MFTEEPSEQITPLTEEHAEPPGLRPSEAFHRPPQPDFVSAWGEVGVSIGVWVASVAALLFVPVIFALPYLVYRIVKFGPPSPEVLSADKGLIFFSVAGVLPTHLLTVVIIWMVVTYGGRRPFWKNIDFRWPEKYNPLAVTLSSVLVAMVLYVVAVGITKLYGEHKTDLDILIESSVYTRMATAFVAVFTAPLAEELIYRGLIYKALQKAAGPAIAIVVVSLLFAGVHVFQYRNNVAVILVITLLSITLTVTRAITGSVLPCFLMHLVFNGIQSFFIVLSGFVDKDIFK